jgi:ABC-type branched-subunit amino acid transport system substrate-binding protein
VYVERSCQDRRKYVGLAFAAAAVLVAGLAACSSSKTSAASNTVSTSPAGTTAVASSPGGAGGSTSASGEPIKIGVVYTDDNPLGVSPEIQDGAKAAASYINANGGMGGRPVQIVACNGKNNPENNVQCATQFVSSKVITVIGLDGVWGANGLSILQKAGITNQTFPISGPEFSSPNAYPLLSLTATAGDAAVQYAVGKGMKSVACIYPDVASLKSACTDFFQTPAKAAGITNITLIPVPPTATDVSQYTTKLSQSHAQLVYSSGSKQFNQGVVQNASQLGFKPQWVFPGDTAQSDFFSALGGAATGAIFWSDLKLWTDSSDPDAVTFNQAMKQYAPKAEVDQNSLEAFSSMMTLKALGDKVGGEKMTLTGLPSVMQNVSDLQSFMGPVLNSSDHLPGWPHALHTGSYLNQWDGSALKPVGKGYYPVTAS